MEKFRSFRRQLLAGLLLLWGFLQTGCVTNRDWQAPRSFDIKLLRDAKLAGDVIAVDVIGVGEESREKVVTAIGNGTYFSQGGSIRKEYLEGRLKLGRSFYFDDTSTPTSVQQTLVRREKIWKDWKRNAVRYLIVAANMPISDGAKSKIDPRILVIPYNKQELSPAIKSGRIIEIKMTQTGLISSPPVD